MVPRHSGPSRLREVPLRGILWWHWGPTRMLQGHLLVSRPLTEFLLFTNTWPVREGACPGSGGQGLASRGPRFSTAGFPVLATGTSLGPVPWAWTQLCLLRNAC